MSGRRFDILYVSQMPASPPRFGAQARVHGLMTQLAVRHEVTAVMLADTQFDLAECYGAMKEYCRDVVLVPNPNARTASSKRLLQLRSLASARSFERLRFDVPELQRELDRMLRSRRFDLVNVEFPYLGLFDVRQAPPSQRPPRVVVDSHEIAFDLAHQFARTGALGRRLYAAANWRKLRREELAAYGHADGISVCSTSDQRRLLDAIPHARTVVVPNAADVEFYRPRPSDPRPDGRTVVYFGLLSTVPNIDGVSYFLKDIWPRVAATHVDARCKIIGAHAPASLHALAGPRVELTGFVSDLRPHLASAAVVVVPLRLGGGTRLKIVEGMAMGKAIVSTSLGAEGIDAVRGRDLLVEDRPAMFADAVSGLLADPTLSARIGASARRLAVERYGWSSAARTLEGFFEDLVHARDAGQARRAGLQEAP